MEQSTILERLNRLERDNRSLKLAIVAIAVPALLLGFRPEIRAAVRDFFGVENTLSVHALYTDYLELRVGDQRRAVLRSDARNAAAELIFFGPPKRIKDGRPGKEEYARIGVSQKGSPEIVLGRGEDVIWKAP